MSLLKKLEEEAAATRRRRALAAAADQAKEAFEEARLSPALERAHRFFRQLQTHLRDIDRVIRTDVFLPEVGTLPALGQRDYRVHGDAGELRAFRFGFRCQGDAPLEVKYDNDAVAAAQERSLRQAGLRCRRHPLGPRRVALRIEPRVPVSLEFSIDTGKGALRLVTRNLFGIGTQSYRFRPEQIDMPLLEALAGCVLREPNRFAELSGSHVEAPRRAQIRKRLAREQRRRRAELGGPLRRALFPLAEWCRRAFLGQ